MKTTNSRKDIFTLLLLILVCVNSFANEAIFKEARELQRGGKYHEAIATYKSLLTQPIDSDTLTEEQLFFYTEALVQLMNSYQSLGEAEACILALDEIYTASPLLQNECLRDFYSVKGYALSRTEAMEAAETTILKVFTLPLYQATPERYFRDYAYAAAVFYSNQHYQAEVIRWCLEALQQAELSKNSSSAQWVKAMLGSLYKQNGHLNEALELLQQSKEEAAQRGDDLAVLNSLHTLIDLFLYWNIPEYANIYATEAVRVERSMTVQNPMVSAQTYINKGRALLQLGETDSLSLYTEQARRLCESLPYNSGMVDVNLLNGYYLTTRGGDSINMGIKELEQVTQRGTTTNRAKAYHQLAQTYLRCEDVMLADIMLDSLYTLTNEGDSPLFIKIDYEPILRHYMKHRDTYRGEQYLTMMLQETAAFKEKRLNFNLVESIVDLKTEQKLQELKISKLKAANQRLWLLIIITVSVVTIATIVSLLIYQRRRYTVHMRKADERFARLNEELNQSNAEKEKRVQEINDFLKENDNRHELETLTPFLLKRDGEAKFRLCFELLHPMFLQRLRDKVPTITRREELLSMLIVLKQNNKEIADLLAIAPRSVLMLRHRFRQKIGINTEYSLENFIEDTLGPQSPSAPTTEE